MSTDEAYDILGVKEGAGFEEIMAAKNKLTRANEADRDKVVKVCPQSIEFVLLCTGA
jgi:DnaJ-class molecular chaperone